MLVASVAAREVHEATADAVDRGEEVKKWCQTASGSTVRICGMGGGVHPGWKRTDNQLTGPGEVDETRSNHLPAVSIQRRRYFQHSIDRGYEKTKALYTAESKSPLNSESPKLAEESALRILISSVSEGSRKRKITCWSGVNLGRQEITVL